MGKSNANTSETIDIENSGNSVTLELNGRTVVSFFINGDSAATYNVDARIVGGTWRQDVGQTYSGSSNHDDAFDTGAEEIRIRCSSGSGTPGDSATIDIMAGGG